MLIDKIIFEIDEIQFDVFHAVLKMMINYVTSNSNERHFKISC